MPARDVFKVSRKTFFNPSTWFGYEGLKDQNKTIWDVLHTIFTVPKPLTEETFEEAMERLGLTEADVKTSFVRYRWYALMFLSLAFISFVYAFYLLFGHHTIIGCILGIAVNGLFLSQAFKYDFWALQLKLRKLGLTWTEWKRHILGEKGSST